jgi:hypothetical protein
MKIMIIKIVVISSLLLFAGWDGAYAEEQTNSQSKSFLTEIWHDHYFWYSLFCGLVSILVKIVDYVIESQVDEKNPNNPQQEIIEQAIPLLGWFVSATIVGYLGVITGFLTTTAQTAVMVGIAWPIVYSRLKATSMEQKKIEKQADEKQLDTGILPDLNMGEEQVTSNECYDVNVEEGK